GGGGRHVDADVDVRRVGGARGVVHADVPEVVALGGLHEVRLGEGAEAVEVEPLRLGGGERVGGAGGVEVHLVGVTLGEVMAERFSVTWFQTPGESSMVWLS